MPTATLTVIIPAYESQSILPRALRSLAAQSCQDFEVLLVSDDGFDYSDMVRAELGERFGHAFTPRLKSGAGVARQTGIALSETAVVGFLDADDEFSPRLIEKLLPLAQAQGAAGSAVLRVDAAKPSGAVRTIPAGMPKGGILKAKHIPWLDAPVVPFVRQDRLRPWPALGHFEDVFFLLDVVARAGGEMPVVSDDDASYRVFADATHWFAESFRDALVSRFFDEVIAQARSGGSLFEDVSPEARQAFLSSYLLKSVRNAAYERAKRREPDLTFRQFSPRFDVTMAALVAQVPTHLQPWAD